MNSPKEQSDRYPGRASWRSIALAGLLIAAYAPALPAHAQNGISAPPRPTTLLMPEANHLPDANDRMMLNNARHQKENFDAANELRQKEIDDETAKLLILAKDFKEEMDKLGDQPLPEKLLREAEVIELLAHDVQTKMTLTVKGG
jgi:hypothetical protein